MEGVRCLPPRQGRPCRTRFGYQGLLGVGHRAPRGVAIERFAPPAVGAAQPSNPVGNQNIHSPNIFRVSSDADPTVGS